MKSLLMLAVIGAVSLVNVLDAEACHRRRCRRGCGNTCNVQQPCYTNGGCQTYGGQMQGYGDQMQGYGYVDPAAVDQGPGPLDQTPVDQAPVERNGPPADPEPVK